MATYTVSCLQQLELALYYDALSVSALCLTSRSLQKSLQHSLYVPLLRLVVRPNARHSLPAAICKLAHLADRGDAEVHRAISKHIQHRRGSVREVALLAVGRVAQKKQ